MRKRLSDVIIKRLACTDKNKSTEKRNKIKKTDKPVSLKSLWVKDGLFYIQNNDVKYNVCVCVYLVSFRVSLDIYQKSTDAMARERDIIIGEIISIYLFILKHYLQINNKIFKRDQNV